MSTLREKEQGKESTKRVKKIKRSFILAGYKSYSTKNGITRAMVRVKDINIDEDGKEDIHSLRISPQIYHVSLPKDEFDSFLQREETFLVDENNNIIEQGEY